uniref:(northern house mosquito) hypothetical protein n=1 Tax=Culex pipiens TaxID=7175 RepID=A0A8D8CMA6_CULPI
MLHPEEEEVEAVVNPRQIVAVTGPVRRCPSATSVDRVRAARCPSEDAPAHGVLSRCAVGHAPAVRSRLDGSRAREALFRCVVAIRAREVLSRCAVAIRAR